MTENKNKLTSINDIGESGLIKKLTKDFTVHNPGLISGLGDDAAILEIGNRLVLTSLSVMNEGIHFNLVYFPLKHLGYKAVISSISNIYAMNARPTQILVGMSVSNRFSVEALEELYSGIRLACDNYKLDLIGGDTNSSLTGLSVAISCIGEGDKNNLTYRTGAKPTDLICVTGSLGGAYLGLQLLERERAIYEENKEMQPDLSGYEFILKRQLKPEIRTDVLYKLSELGIQPGAMTDVTDGLVADLLHVCESSKTGCRIYQENIPIDDESDRAAEEFHLEPVTCALNGGDDFELLFTVPVDKYDTLTQIANVHVIGHITPPDEGKKLITINNEAVDLTGSGKT